MKIRRSMRSVYPTGWTDRRESDMCLSNYRTNSVWGTPHDRTNASSRESYCGWLCSHDARRHARLGAGQGRKFSRYADQVNRFNQPAFTRAPDFNLRDGGGGSASLSGSRGNLVLLNFWATRCAPCREEMPSMEQLSRSFGGQGFTVMAVNQRENAAQVMRYMKTHGLNFRAPLDTDGRVAALTASMASQ